MHEFESGFFVKQPAWHGLGTVLQQPPTVQEALKLAGLDWTVRTERLGRMTVPVGLNQETGIVEAAAPTPVFTPANRWAVVRESDNTELGTVGPKWRALQNEKALGWFQPIVDAGLATLEAAGSLRAGARVWVLARITGGRDVIVEEANDAVDRFILLAHGHDGALAIRCGLTFVRVVCNNTLQAALSGDELIRILHGTRAEETLAAAREVITRANGRFDEAAKIYRALAQVKNVGAAQLRAFVEAAFPRPVGPKNGGGSGGDGGGNTPAPEVDGQETKSRIYDDVARLFESGQGAQLPGVKGTAWAAYNAMTEWLTHERGKDAEIRLNNSFFGPEGGRAIAAAIDTFLPGYHDEVDTKGV
jgi:phage/plasmid-like protein (TIGR03299 family)